MKAVTKKGKPSYGLTTLAVVILLKLTLQPACITRLIDECWLGHVHCCHWHITQRSPAARMKVLRYETYSGYLDAHVILKPEFVQKQSVL